MGQRGQREQPPCHARDLRDWIIPRFADGIFHESCSEVRWSVPKKKTYAVGIFPFQSNLGSWRSPLILWGSQSCWGERTGLHGTLGINLVPQKNRWFLCPLSSPTAMDFVQRICFHHQRMVMFFSRVLTWICLAKCGVMRLMFRGSNLICRYCIFFKYSLEYFTVGWVEPGFPSVFLLLL